MASLIGTNNTVKSINLTRFEQIMSKNIPFSIMQYSTLNEKFQISHSEPPASGYPQVKYLAIGNGGHSYTLGVNNIPSTNINMHSITDAALFNHIPFALVPVSSDLTPAQRAKYRIRVLETINGVDYFAYYLKVLETDVTAPSHNIVTISNGGITSTIPYVPSTTNLTPTPVVISNTNVNTADGRHLETQVNYPIMLSTDDAASILNACMIKYGDPGLAMISEIGLVSGYDYTNQSTLGNIPITYTEIQTAQIMAFIGTACFIETVDSSFGWQIALSSTQPFPPTNVI